MDLTADGVPEPATWPLMIAGLRMVGFALRRRRGGKWVVACLEKSGLGVAPA